MEFIEAIRCTIDSPLPALFQFGLSVGSHRFREVVHDFRCPGSLVFALCCVVSLKGYSADELSSADLSDSKLSREWRERLAISAALLR